MKYNVEKIGRYFMSIAFLLLTFLMFILLFCFRQSDKNMYFICLAMLIIFCIFYSSSNKKILCEDGYNWIQAYFFYKKCRAKGVKSKPHRIRKTEVEMILEVTKEFDFCRNFDCDKAVKIYEVGYEVSKII